MFVFGRGESRSTCIKETRLWAQERTSRDGCSHHCIIPRSPPFLYIWSYRSNNSFPPLPRSHHPLCILENLFQQPLPRGVPIDLFPCCTQRGSTWTGLVLECSASLLYLEEFQSSCMFLSPLEDLLLRLLRSSKPMFKWVDRVVFCPPNGSINVNWGLIFGWIWKTSLTRQESIIMHLPDLKLLFLIKRPL